MARVFVWDQRTTFEPEVGYVLAPGTWLWGREGWALSHWDAHGVRRAPEALSDASPVLVAGDSLTEAVHVSDEATFGYRLGELLTSRGVSVRVVAVGRSGASLPDYIRWSAHWDELFHPRVVVVAVSDDDFVWDAWNAGKPHFVADPRGVHVEGDAPQPYGGAMLGAWHIRQSSMALGIFPARLGEYRAALAAETPMFRAAEAVSVPAPITPRHAVAPQLALLVETFGPRLVVLHLATLDPFDPDHTTDVENELARECTLQSVACAWSRSDLARMLDASQRNPYGFGQGRFGIGHLNELGHAAVARSLAPVVATQLAER
jgi:hypothetical protein